MRAKWPSVCITVFLFISLLLMIYALLRDSLLAAVGGLPCLVFLLSLLHELGHALGCLINGNRVTGFHIFFVQIRSAALSFSPRPGLQSYCAFIGKEHNGAVYLSGPLCSLAVVLVILGVFLITHQRVWGLYLAVSALHCVKNLIPYGNSDMSAFMKEIKRKR